MAPLEKADNAILPNRGLDVQWKSTGIQANHIEAILYTRAGAFLHTTSIAKIRKDLGWGQAQNRFKNSKKIHLKPYARSLIFTPIMTIRFLPIWAVEQNHNLLHNRNESCNGLLTVGIALTHLKNRIKIVIIRSEHKS